MLRSLDQCLSVQVDGRMGIVDRDLTPDDCFPISESSSSAHHDLVCTAAISVLIRRIVDDDATGWLHEEE